MDQGGRIEYAQQLAALGDKVNEISEKFMQLNLEHKHTFEIAASLGHVALLLEKYEEVLLEATQLSVPSAIIKEHADLVSAFETLVNGTRLIKQSITVYADGTQKDAGSLDAEMFTRGFSMQKKSVDATDKAILAIIGRFQKH